MRTNGIRFDDIDVNVEVETDDPRTGNIEKESWFDEEGDCEEMIDDNVDGDVIGDNVGKVSEDENGVVVVVGD